VARIYTKTGDDGTTGLIGGKRVSKNSPCIEACGSLDELNATLGVARSLGLPTRVEAILQLVQDDLFIIGAELAVPSETIWRGQSIGDEEVRKLEREIDAVEKDLEPLKNFILPGGSIPGAQLHLARAVARRAERHCVALYQTEKVNPAILRYLNRLSDLCFVLARYVNRQQSMPEPHPAFRKTQE
jgi:cob(I)alamin adenosyltransferase